MKVLVASSLLVFLCVPAFTGSAAAASLPRHQPKQSYDQPYQSGVDLTQSGPIHRGPIFRGFPLSDWYVY